MILFEKEKELIWKITNAILLIWFVGAIVFTAGSAIDLAVKEPIPTYEEYRLSDGYYMEKEGALTEAEIETRTRASYNQMYGYQEYYKLKALYISLANVVIVGGALYIINRHQGKKA